MFTARRADAFLVCWFGPLAVLNLIAISDLGLIIVSFFLPLLFMVMAAPTVFLYSAAALPLWFVVTRGWGSIVLVPLTLALPIAIAIVPGWVSRKDAIAFAQRATADDMRQPTTVTKPRFIELRGDHDAGLFQVGGPDQRSAPCGDICRRLLLGGDAERVRMTRVSTATTTVSATYHLEHRASCPSFAHGDYDYRLDPAVRDRLLAGDCIIADSGDYGPADAVVEFTTLPEDAPLVLIKKLRIDVRRDDALASISRQTEVVARTLGFPFYIGIELRLRAYSGPTIGRDRFVVNAFDLPQTLRTTFGYSVGEVRRTAPLDYRSTAEQTLALTTDTAPSLSPVQQEAFIKALSGIARDFNPTDDDLAFVRRVIADQRVTAAGGEVRAIIRRSAKRFEPFIPLILDRLSVHGVDDAGSRSALGWALAESYEIGSLLPYRERIVNIVADQPKDWAVAGLVTRLAELETDDGVKLIIRLLDDRNLDSSAALQSAAIAACRATPDVWSQLEPAVLSLVSRPREGWFHGRLDALVLALRRFGKDEIAYQYLEKHNLSKFVPRLRNDYKPGFSAERCGDWF